ncbi:radical SAM family heme chaperone HemW [Desulfurobacterium sp.]
MIVRHLYIHVPFCRTKCPYCDFYSTTEESNVKEYLYLLKKELEIREIAPIPETIYFGGGTPSLMPPLFFESILNMFPSAKEITVEANPEDLTLKYLKALKTSGINRISIGIQTFQEKLLKILNRRYNSEKALKSLYTATSIFDNVSIDIMFGIPGQNEEDLKKDLLTATNFPITHISCYALTIYEGTPFYNQVKKGRLELPSEEKFSKYYEKVIKILQNKGFSQYEISNFSRPNFECKHNLAYWNLKSYLGIGPSAASLIFKRYFKNISNYKEYRKGILSGNPILEEDLTFNEKEFLKIKIAMGLRKNRGIKLNSTEKNIFLSAVKKSSVLQTLLSNNVTVFENELLKLNPKYFLLSTNVIAKIINEI